MQNSWLSVNVQGQTKLPKVDRLLEALEEYLSEVYNELDLADQTRLSPTQLNVSCDLKLQFLVEQSSVVNLSYGRSWIPSSSTQQS